MIAKTALFAPFFRYSRFIGLYFFILRISKCYIMKASNKTDSVNFSS
ncbi:hypothetical protein D1BOALGB6SA_398 [Olavius sp. associated proteobacterium Delta 1]|nr:hypothetical protein D1BOALGB6SA_398 [Olavius sp. associated proteobacterium Delta 1]